MVLSAVEKNKGGRVRGWNFKPDRQRRPGKAYEVSWEERHEGASHIDIMKNCSLER